MYKYFLLLLTLLTIILPNQSFANSRGLITSLRSYDHSNYTRFVIEINNYEDYEYFILTDPSRLVIDLKNATLKKSIIKEAYLSRYINKVRYAQFDQNIYRISIDLPDNFIINKSFLLNEKDTTKVVFDIAKNEEEFDYLAAFQLSDKPIENNQNNNADIIISNTKTSPHFKNMLVPIPKLKHNVKNIYKPLIIIDAGHGGNDPGSISKTGIREKDITLHYAKELAKLLENTGKFRIYLTRPNDKFISLHDRVKKARNQEGDLFISLHADNHPNKSTKGLSVYTISEKSSDREAERMAQKENAADLLGDVSNAVFDYEQDINELLFDLVQRNTKNHSAKFAQILIHELKSEVKLLRNTHRFAGFRVLTSPEIPSVLIELGYLSNKQEEKLLTTDLHRQKITRGIANSIIRFFG